MDSGWRYFQWLSYVVVICSFGGIMFATFSEATLIILQNII
ncbi:hypothetical protein [Shewanella benthica]|uniref:Seryl-tRNA synthetase n=1 Tax=Shewanella benthica KT99 TaxID=314608 RepID=A9DLZ5_9GAMM|nr:hypothetical protein [Shewanella benthica]EDP98778.1 seryl-tRNA synthetase [Shewanella benthica KT99]